MTLAAFDHPFDHVQTASITYSIRYSIGFDHHCRGAARRVKISSLRVRGPHGYLPAQRREIETKSWSQPEGTGDEKSLGA
jgi:hypothetical protein